MHQYPLLCLVGLHGTGKTTLARDLARHHGFAHLSLGDLGRLSRKGRLPSDIPPQLMVSVARSKPGGILDAGTAKLLFQHIDGLRKSTAVVVDGFPACPDHLAWLDDRSLIGRLHLTDSLRELRLTRRSELGPRKWTPGGHSARDASLAETVHAARTMGLHLETFNNGGEKIEILTDQILHWMTTSLDANTHAGIAPVLPG